MSNKQKRNQESLKFKKAVIKSKNTTFFIDLSKVGISTKTELEEMIRSQGIRPEEIFLNFEKVSDKEDLSKYFLIQKFGKSLGKRQFLLKRAKK
jgi:hypothetical protein